jgi:flagellar M-ring protein FliF
VELKKITDLVRAAIGFDEGRGDLLIVENVPFDSEASGADEVAGGFGWGGLLTAARYLSLPLAVLLLALLVVRPGIAALRTLRLEPGRDEPGPPTVAHLQARLQALRDGGGLRLAGEGSDLRRKLIEAAAQDPKTAALILRGWLGGGQDRS